MNSLFLKKAEHSTGGALNGVDWPKTSGRKPVVYPHAETRRHEDQTSKADQTGKAVHPVFFHNAETGLSPWLFSR